MNKFTAVILCISSVFSLIICACVLGIPLYETHFQKFEIDLQIDGFYQGKRRLLDYSVFENSNCDSLMIDSLKMECMFLKSFPSLKTAIETQITILSVSFVACMLMAFVLVIKKNRVVQIVLSLILSISNVFGVIFVLYWWIQNWIYAFYFKDLGTDIKLKYLVGLGISTSHILVALAFFIKCSAASCIWVGTLTRSILSKKTDFEDIE